MLAISESGTEHNTSQFLLLFVQRAVFHDAKFQDRTTSKRPPVEITVSICSRGGNHSDPGSNSVRGHTLFLINTDTLSPGCGFCLLLPVVSHDKLQIWGRACFWPWFINTALESLLLITDFVLLIFFSRGLAVIQQKQRDQATMGFFFKQRKEKVL